jgi:galactitol-specific phosphotransferase system IIB component
MYDTLPILVHVMSDDGIHNMKTCLTEDMNRKWMLTEIIVITMKLKSSVSKHIPTGHMFNL